MSNGSLIPVGNQAPLAPRQNEDKAKRTRESYKAGASSDFYGGIGWMIGLLITLFASTPILLYIAANASRSTRDQILAVGIAIAWWFNPLALGALGYIFSNVRLWRFWTVFAILVWAVVNALSSLSIASEPIRGRVVVGLVIFFYVLFGLWILYIQLRVFLWAAGG